MKEGSRKGEATRGRGKEREREGKRGKEREREQTKAPRHRERKKEEPIGLPRRGEREWARETEGT